MRHTDRPFMDVERFVLFHHSLVRLQTLKRMVVEKSCGSFDQFLYCISFVLCVKRQLYIDTRVSRVYRNLSKNGFFDRRVFSVQHQHRSAIRRQLRISQEEEKEEIK